jgi:hypothetical protein
MAFDKKRLRREIEKARKETLKARLTELAGLIKAERAKRWEAIRAVQLDCRLQRQQLRDSCGLRRLQASEAGRKAIEQAQGILVTERRDERRLASAGMPRKARATARERAGESDDEVRANLAPELVRVFDKVRRHIKGSPRKSRTEAFLQWAEENPGEVYEIQQHDADRYLAQLLAEEARTAREMRRRSTAGVPF